MNIAHNIIELVKFLYTQRVKGFPPPGDEPFMDQSGMSRFKLEVARAKSYVEFGAGGSTIYVDRAGIPAISVENDPYYARAVASRLIGGKVIQRVVRMGITKPWGVPLFPRRSMANAYISAPWGANPFPDVILIDGRFRVACALESARRAREAMATAIILFDDYANRPHYHAVERYLGKPELSGRLAIFTIGSQPLLEVDVHPWLDDWR